MKTHNSQVKAWRKAATDKLKTTADGTMPDALSPERKLKLLRRSIRTLARNGFSAKAIASMLTDEPIRLKVSASDVEPYMGQAVTAS
jgi:hypothetical protein